MQNRQNKKKGRETETKKRLKQNVNCENRTARKVKREREREARGGKGDRLNCSQVLWAGLGRGSLMATMR